MTIRFDEKGKYFTDVVSKNEVPAVIQTLTHQIHGYLFVRPGKRLKDEMNTAEQFLAVTDADVYDLHETLLYRCRFMTIQRDHIIWVIPDSELVENGTTEAGKV